MYFIKRKSGSNAVQLDVGFSQFCMLFDQVAGLWTVFTAQCTIVRSAVLRSHVVCLSVTLVDC